MTFPIVSTIQTGLNNIKTALDTLTSIQASIDGLSLASTSTVTIGIGGTTWSGTVPNGDAVTIYDAEPLTAIIGTYLWRGKTSGDIEMGQFEIVGPPFNITRGGVPYIDLQLSSEFTALMIESAFSEDVDLTLSFSSIPLVSSGVIGPTGPTGPTGATGATGAAGENWGAWTNLTFGSGWSNYDSQYNSAQYRLSTASSSVQLRGILTATVTSNYVIATLPANARPLKHYLVNCPCNDAYCQITIRTGGNIQYMNPVSGSTWISLDNITFSTA